MMILHMMILMENTYNDNADEDFDKENTCDDDAGDDFD